MISVTHLATYPHGGAAIAMRRLSDRLVQRGNSSSCTTQFDHGRCGVWINRVAQVRAFADKMSFRFSKGWDGSYFSPANIPSCGWLDEIPSRSILHVHWLGAGALRIEEFSRLPRPIVWTLHDEWLYTGGCHYGKAQCDRYMTGCGACPVLGSTKEHDLSRRVWRRKATAWPMFDIAAIIAPSCWIAGRTAKSPLLAGRRIEVIPNPIDTTVFSPMSKDLARKELGLPADKKVLFFAGGARRDPVRGIDLLEEAMLVLGKESEAVLCVVGKPFLRHEFGRVGVYYLPMAHDDEAMRRYYAAADVTVMPSRVANLSNTLIESLACGTPAVAFNVGGNGEIVDHKKSGYLAVPGDANDFAEGVRWMLDNDPQRLGECGRTAMIERFSTERIIPRFLALYEEIAEATKK